MVSPIALNTMADSSEQNANGLPSAIAIARLKQDGYNELPSAQSRSLLAIAWGTVQDPIFLLLFGGGLIYWILGDFQEKLSALDSQNT